MPMQPFVKLFESWGENVNLDLKRSRLKAITLLAFAIMTRPSDLAPKAVFFKESGPGERLILRRDQLSFHEDGTLTVTLFGTKNDLHRKGFSVTIQPADNLAVDPVSCLAEYIKISQVHRLLCDNDPLFVSLKKPFSAITAGTVGEQLNTAITLAGLAERGFSAKSFRPTAATVAIATGCDPDVARKIGRWECPAVFFDHYVHIKTPSNFLNNMFTHN